MAGILQEKFQVDNAQNTNDDAQGGWVDAKRARAKKDMPGREGLPHGDPPSRTMNNAANFNSLPPGMDIEDQEVSDIRRFRESMAGQSDVSRDTNQGALDKGYTRRELRPTDDEYTKAHQDAFYDEIEVDGNVGFAERNNVLDRL